MMSSTYSRARPGVSILVAALMAAACGEASTPIDGGPEREAAPAGPGIHALLADPTGVSGAPVPPGVGDVMVVRPTAGTVALRLYLVPVGVESRVSSYQIELRYDPELLTFEGSSAADGVMGSAHEPEPGRVRLAGVALDGVPADGAVDLEFGLTADRGDTELVLAIEEIIGDLGDTDLTARSIPRRLGLVWGPGS